jgi:hypothetical protein
MAMYNMTLETLDFVAPPVSYYSDGQKAHSTPRVKANDARTKFVAAYKIDILTSGTVEKGKENYVKEKAARATLQARVNSYSTLLKGWDGHKANPVSDGCIQNATKILNAISLSMINEININDIFPTPNGTITFEVTRGEETYFVLDIGKTSLLYYYRNNDSLAGIDESVEITDEVIASVCKLFKEFLQEVDQQSINA